MGFCDIVLPIDAVSACCYFSYLREANSKVGAIKIAYNALKWAQAFVPGLNKSNDPLEDYVVKRVYESCLRSIKPDRNVKAPLTADLLNKVIENVSQTSSLRQVRNATILALAHNVLLRHDEVSHLSCAHISEKKDHFVIRIISSKTDTLRNGKDVILAKSSGVHSISSLLERYLKLAGLSLGSNHFLFCPLNGNGLVVNKKLSYSSYRQILKESVESIGADPSLYGFHSCRSGGATDLASQVSSYELLNAGRWKDPRSLRHYVQIPTNRRLEWSKNLQDS